MKLELSTEQYEFLNRIVAKPCMQDLAGGGPLIQVLHWAYLLGLWHGRQITLKAEDA